MKTVKIKTVINRLEDQDLIQIDPFSRKIWIAQQYERSDKFQDHRLSWIYKESYIDLDDLYSKISGHYAHLVLGENECLAKKFQREIDKYNEKSAMEMNNLMNDAYWCQEYEKGFKANGATQ